MSIFSSLQLCCWNTTLAVLLLDLCVLELRCGSAGVVSGLPAEAQLVLLPGGSLVVQQHGCQSWGVESYMRTYWVQPFCRNNVLSRCLMTCMIGPCTGCRCAAWVLTALIVIKVKVQVSLTSHEDSERGCNIELLSILWLSSEVEQQRCKLHALSSLHPQRNSLWIISVRGWMYPRTPEYGQKNSVTWQLSKDT